MGYGAGYGGGPYHGGGGGGARNVQRAPIYTMILWVLSIYLYVCILCHKVPYPAHNMTFYDKD